MWHMIIGALFPDQCDIIGSHGYFEVFTKLGVALQAKNEKILLQLAKIAFQGRKLATVDVKHFDQVAVNDRLNFSGDFRWRRLVTWIWLFVLCLLDLRFYLYDRLGYLLFLLFNFWPWKYLFQVDEHDAPPRLEKLLDLPEDEVATHTYAIEPIWVRLEGCLIGKLDDFWSYDYIFFILNLGIPRLHCRFDEFSWPFCIFCIAAYDTFHWSRSFNC